MPGMTFIAPMLASNRKAALDGLAQSLDLSAQQVKVLSGLQARLHSEAPVVVSNNTVSDDESRFAQISAELLERAGGGMSLTAAAKMVETSRQALHKRITKGTVLGLMRGGELVIPRAQWIEKNGKTAVMAGIAEVLAEFSVAGRWSALQFLVEPDPNLAATPLVALAQGKVAEVVHAARAYLGADEE
jgi:hypothetical protein